MRNVRDSQRHHTSQSIRASIEQMEPRQMFSVTYDIGQQWSDTANPMGMWTVRHGATPLPHHSNWIPGNFTGVQPAWARTAAQVVGHVPSWLKSTFEPQFANDWQVGDVVTHTTSNDGTGAGASNLAWTSPADGIAEVRGAVWMGRDIGRSNKWAVLKNGVELTSGNIASGDKYSRLSPFNLANGAGGSNAIQNLRVSRGDSIELRFTSTTFYGDFVGVRFAIDVASTGSIAGQKFNDLDGDGVKDAGEAGLANWKLFLDADKDGVFDTGEKSTTTDASGNYKFSGLPAASYRVREVLKPGWRQTAPSSGYHDIALAARQNVTGKSFGNTQKVLITGRKWNDLDADGVKDTGEPGLSNWRVFIDTDKDSVWDANEKSVLTSTSGSYSFKDLAAGTYRVREVPKTGWRRTAPSSGYYDVTLASGASTTRNFGNTQKVLISGTVFNDLDGDKIKDSGERGLAGWRVFIDKDLDGAFDSGETSVVSDALGNWSFRNLPAGNYRVRVVQQSGWKRTTPSSGYHSIALASGAISAGKLFGEKRIA